MTKALSIVHGALEPIGAHSVINPAAPETITRGTQKLAALIKEWKATGLDLSARVPVDSAAEIDELEGSTEALTYGLMYKMAPILRKSISTELDNEASKSIRLARERWQYEIPEERPRGFRLPTPCCIATLLL